MTADDPGPRIRLGRTDSHRRLSADLPGDTITPTTHRAEAGSSPVQTFRSTRAARTVSGRSFLQTGQQVLVTAGRDLHSPAGRAAQPALCGEVLVEFVCQLASEVVATLGPVKASVRKATPAVGLTGVHSPPSEPRVTRSREFEAPGSRRQASFSLKGVKDQNPELTGQVAVAASRKAQTNSLRMCPRGVMIIALGNKG